MQKTPQEAACGVKGCVGAALLRVVMSMLRFAPPVAESRNLCLTSVLKALGAMRRRNGLLGRRIRNRCHAKYCSYYTGIPFIMHELRFILYRMPANALGSTLAKAADTAT